MRPTTMALMCLLLAAVWLQDVDSKSILSPSNRCCSTTSKKKIPLKLIQCFRNMSSTCSHLPAVVFRLKKGRESCALTSDTWVQDHLKEVDRC
ncbi:C-C motif chemokine 1 [Mastomys coucha]|uniref:C-C motif chemokine 1 n=1 Tax=Mastomys coucha TaxID=35658 RepID=UPI00126228CD|nr:C-C motif chemokine 1 [Mastomys coucha]